MKQLQEYMKTQYEVNCTMSLLNNPAGRHVLIFSDPAVKYRFSFVLYNLLYDGNYMKLLLVACYCSSFLQMFVRILL